MASLDLGAWDAVGHGDALDLVELAPEQEGSVRGVRVSRVHMRDVGYHRLSLAHDVERELVDGLDQGVRAVAPVDAAAAAVGSLDVETVRGLDTLVIDHLGPV